MDDTILRLVEQLPLSAGVLIIMFTLGRRFLSIWESQVKMRDQFLEKLLERYSTLDSALEVMDGKMDAATVDLRGQSQTFASGMTEITQQLVVLQKGVDSFAGRMVDAMQHMDTVLKGWGVVTSTTTDAINELKGLQQAELTTLRQEVQKKMDNIEQGNHTISRQLAELTDRLNRLIGVLEAANWEEFAQIPVSVNACLTEIQAAVGRVAVQDQQAGSAQGKGRKNS